MTAKKPSRSKQPGGRVTPKGTKPTGSEAGHPKGPSGAFRGSRPRFDPVRSRQFAGHTGPNRSAHRGNR